MARIFEILAEQRLQDALRRGELDNLPGAGQPLELDDDPLLTPEQRLFNRILKNAGFTPHEVLLRKEIAALRERLADLPDGPARDATLRELSRCCLTLLETKSHG